MPKWLIGLVLVLGCRVDATRPDPSGSLMVAELAGVTTPQSILRVRGSVDIKPLLIPSPGFPANEDPITETADGFTTLIRGNTGNRARNIIRLGGLTPGHVYLYELAAFNHPEFCVHGRTQFPEPSPCWSQGPTNLLDGTIPEADYYVAAYRAKVARTTRLRFAVDLVGDEPTEIFLGTGLTNPSGAFIAVGILDKGPELPEGHPLRSAQFNSIRGGCQGPPFFGPLTCEFAGVQQHLPPASSARVGS